MTWHARSSWRKPLWLSLQIDRVIPFAYLAVGSRAEVWYYAVAWGFAAWASEKRYADLDVQLLAPNQLVVFALEEAEVIGLLTRWCSVQGFGLSLHDIFEVGSHLQVVLRSNR